MHMHWKLLSDHIGLSTVPSSDMWINQVLSMGSVCCICMEANSVYVRECKCKSKGDKAFMMVIDLAQCTWRWLIVSMWISNWTDSWALIWHHWLNAHNLMFNGITENCRIYATPRTYIATICSCIRRENHARISQIVHLLIRCKRCTC